MTSLALAVNDSAVMLRRNLRHLQRYPSLTGFLVGMPVVFLLLFVFVLGGTLGAGLGGPAGGRADYLVFVVPGILMVTVAGSAQGTAISVAMDMTEGILARFGTMAISRVSVLTGHVIASLIQSLICLVVVTGVALAIGFRTPASALDWLAVFGLLMLITLSLTWLCVAFGLVATSVESASNFPMFLALLPFFGSGFVPTDSLPIGVRWFAEYQPFTPIINTVRALLTGTPVGDQAICAVGWCLVTGIACYLWARVLYRRTPTRQ